MTMRRAAAASFLLIFMTSACSLPAKTPNIRQNPQPAQRFEITLKISKDAPGPFEAVVGAMQYEVDGDDTCAPKRPMIGLHDIPGQYPPVVFTQVDDHTYKGAAYTDLMQDDDYYGMGVCRWHLTFVTAELKNKNNKISLTPSISLAEVNSQKSVTFYFPKAVYTETTSLSFPDGGARSLDDALKFPSGYFSIVVSSTKTSP